MRPLTLSIAGQVADLPATTKGLIKFTQARASLADIAARVGEFSFPLTLPATRRNQQIFGVDKLHPQGLSKFGNAVDYPYQIEVGGQSFMGTFRLSSLKNGYTGSLVGAGLSWALLLGDAKLPDLSFPSLQYDGSQLAGILTKNCDATDLQFPLVAFGNFFSPPTQQVQPDGSTKEVPAPAAAVLDYPLSVDDYPPGVYYVNVLRQIFAGIGWQLQGRELDSEFWRSIVFTCAGIDLDGAWPWGSLLLAQGAGSSQRSFSYYGQGPGNGYTNNAVGFWTLPGDGPELSGDIFFLPVGLGTSVVQPTRTLDLPGATYTALRAGTYDFEWSATLSGGHNYFGGPNIDSHDYFVQALLRPIGLGLVVRRGGQDFAEAEGGLLRGDPAVNASFSYKAGQDRVLTPQRLDVAGGTLGTMQNGARQGTASVFLEVGDSVTLSVFARRMVFDGSNNLLAYRSQAEYTFSATSLKCTGYADNDGVSKTTLQPAAFLPPLLQKELVRDFLLRTDSFIQADPGRRVATLLSRSELSSVGGEPLDLSDLCDPRSVEFSPAVGANVGSLVFSPAASGDDPLAPAGTDVVTARVGPGDSSQSIGSLFAPVGSRTVYLSGGAAAIPTCSTKEILAQDRSETQPDPRSQQPRLVRYTGPDASLTIPFGTTTVPLAGATWDGPLAWDGEAGAVASYYAGTIRRALFGHLGRAQAPLSPALYQQLQPGRRVVLHGAAYTVEQVNGFDIVSEDSLTDLQLSREVV